MVTIDQFVCAQGYYKICNKQQLIVNYSLVPNRDMYKSIYDQYIIISVSLYNSLGESINNPYYKLVIVIFMA
jgi:hypothetical protein